MDKGLSSVKNINDLPRELLLLIFAQGCKVEILSEFNIGLGKFHTRRRKPFAALARKVCPYWRALLDSTDHASLFSQWFATTGLDTRFDVRPVNQFIRLQETLRDSQNCDLIVSFIFVIQPWPGRWKENIFLRLFLFGLEAVIAYARQIVHLTLTCGQSTISRWFLDLLQQLDVRTTICSLKMARSIDGLLISEKMAPRLLLSHYIEKEDWERIPHPLAIRLPVSDILDVDDPVQLEKIYVPFSISKCQLTWYLEEGSEHPIAFLHRILSPGTPNSGLCSSLTVLILKFRDGISQYSYPGSAPTMEEGFTGPISLPNLCTLAFNTSKIKFSHFFTCFEAPRLSKIDVFFSYIFEELRQWENAFEDVQSVLNFPVLSSVLVKSRSPLWHYMASDGCSIRNRDGLQHLFCPGTLSLTMEASGAEFILNSLNLTHLKQLFLLFDKSDINFSNLLTPMPSTFFKRNFFSPSLQKIGFSKKFYEVELVNFLGALVADDLRIVSMEEYPSIDDSRGRQTLEALPSACFPSVQFVELAVPLEESRSRGTYLLKKIFPNAEIVQV